MKTAIKWIFGLILCIIGVVTTPVLIGIWIFAIGVSLMKDE
jgi:hypothetical protein